MSFANESGLEWLSEEENNKLAEDIEKLEQLKQQSQITGVLDRIRFSNPDNGYCVLVINHKNPAVQITAVGHMSTPQEGTKYLLKGKWTKHDRYGDQFKFDEFEVVLPTNKTGIAKYLESRIFGVGEVRSKEIVDVLGEDALDKIKADPNILKQFDFIGESQINQISEDLVQNEAQANFTASICRRGVTPQLASRIWVTYIGQHVPADEILSMIEENPYILIDDIDRIGFITADKVAQALGIEKDSPFRIQAAVKHVLKEATNDGHVYLPFSKIYKLVSDLLDIVVDEMEIAILVKKMADDMGVLARESNDVYLKSLIKAENQLSDRIKMLLEVEDNTNPDDEMLDTMVGYEQKMLQTEISPDFEYAPEQIEAIRKAMKNNISIITGGPGTGKTTVINSICTIYHRYLPEDWIHLASPTGKAAKRMEEATGRKAKTIHRLLRYSPYIDGFEFGYDNPLPGPGLLIVDEFSMADILLSRDLFAAVEDLKVVLVGDVDQLPSVGPGSVLRDMINSGVVPTTRLKYNYRQANGSVVARMANEIADGIVPELKNEGDFEYIRVTNDEAAEREIIAYVEQLVADNVDINDFQVLSPMKRGSSGVNNLNEKIRDIVNPADKSKPELGRFRLFDKVMVVKNNYQLGVMNGNVGKVVNVQKNKLYVNILDNDSPEPVEFKVEDLMILELAYACTIHKFQGSEVPVVLMPLTNSHYMMLRRNLAYTGITRAKDKLVLVADKRAFKRAVKNNLVEKRYSKLAEKLRGRNDGSTKNSY